MALFGLAATVVRAEPVAMVVHLAGHAKVTRGGGELPARLLLKLEPKDRVRCSAGSEVGIVMVTGGKRFLLAGDQTGTVTEIGVDGAKPMAGLRGPSLEAANKLAGTQAGVNFARPRGSAAVDLVTDFKGWLPAGTRQFRWNAKDRFQVDTGRGAKLPSSCTFSVFDRTGYLVWSAHTTTSEVDYPADLPPLETGVPYTWRLDAFGEDGRPLRDKLPWGIVTFLDDDHARQLKEQTADLEKQIAEHPTDATAKVLLAETYHRFGVLMQAVRLVDQVVEPGDDDLSAQRALYEEAGSLALLLSGNAVPAQNKDIHP
jgi:hypothetical protein